MTVFTLVILIHIQIPTTGYVGLIIRSTPVATASLSAFESTVSGATTHAVLQNTLKVSS